MHEIITLQLGSQANYVGTHFWNTQESYFTYGSQEESPIDHDIHFRAGIGADGSDTYLPRAVIYDFKAGFGTLRRVNELYEVVEGGNASGNGNVWTNTPSTQTQTHTQPAIPAHPYQLALSRGLPTPRLQPSDIRYWSDYNRIYHHPRSLIQIYETELGPEQRGFDTWSAGEDLFRQLDSEDDLFDRDVRPVVEECDQMQGVQLLAGVEGGWGGFAARYVERLRDELGKTGMWVWALGEGGGGGTATARANKLVNSARALHEISPAVSMYIPLSLPSQIYSHHPWHTSAIQALTLETLTLPSRLRRSQGINAASLSELAVVLNPSDERKIAQARVQVMDVDGPRTLSALLQEWNLAPSPTAAEGDVRVFAEYDVRRARDEDEDQIRGNGHNNDDDEREGNYRRFNTPLPFPFLDSFPPLFTTTSNNQAPSSQHQQPTDTQDPSQQATLSLLATLSITSATSTWLKSLERVARTRVAAEEREELVNGLMEIGEAYRAGFEGDEEAEWDL